MLSHMRLDNVKGEYCKDVKFRNVRGHFTVLSLATYAALYQLMLIGETIKPSILKEVLQDFLRLNILFAFFPKTKKLMKTEKVF